MNRHARLRRPPAGQVPPGRNRVPRGRGRPSPVRALLLLPGLTLLLAAPAVAQEEFRWTGTMEEGGTLAIYGVNGDIEASPASGNRVEVVAEKRGERSDPASVEIEVVEHGNGVTVCAIYPTPPGRDPNECRPGGSSQSVEDNDVVVDFTVRVPAGARLRAHTVNGGVEASDIGGDVDAKAVNGGIDIRASGTVEARTVNGPIQVAMGRLPSGGTLEFETVNGPISLELPANADADVKAETVNGDIDTDFPLTVQGRFGPRRVQGTIGNGGPELRLKTVNGGIELRRGS